MHFFDSPFMMITIIILNIPPVRTGALRTQLKSLLMFLYVRPSLLSLP